MRGSTVCQNWHGGIVWGLSKSLSLQIIISITAQTQTLRIWLLCSWGLPCGFSVSEVPHHHPALTVDDCSLCISDGFPKNSYNMTFSMLETSTQATTTPIFTGIENQINNLSDIRVTVRR